jgi:hypothetical protein
MGRVLSSYVSVTRLAQIGTVPRGHKDLERKLPGRSNFYRSSSVGHAGGGVLTGDLAYISSF